MAELDDQSISTSTPEQPPVPPEAVEQVVSARSRVKGLSNDKLSSLGHIFEMSAKLQNKIAGELSKVPNSSKPKITTDMIAVVAIAQGLSGRFKEVSAVDLSTFMANDKPTFRLGEISFEYLSGSDDKKNWVHAFNEMIDQIDPDNNLRFVS